MSMHEGQPLLTQGPEFSLASGAMIMIHGRGAGAADIIGLAPQFRYEQLSFCAPQAADNSWYPYSFLVPIQQNEPGLSSALTVVSSLVLEAELSSIPREKIFILGFSQGACLALEYAARNPARYGGIFGLSGGLIGPPGTAWESDQSLEGTPVFIGCSDVDPHIPRSRVEESAEVLERLGAVVTMQIYPGLGHTINGSELEAINAILGSALSS